MSKPTALPEKKVDYEGELSNAQRMFQKLAPMCSVEKRALGIPQLAPQEKQIDILEYEYKETSLCINLAKKGLHAIRDNFHKAGIRHSVIELEHLNSILRNEKLQEEELDCLISLSQKQMLEFYNQVPNESEELEYSENANNRLKRMENRLDLATKKLCVVDTENQFMRSEIDRLLCERKNFNIEWKKVIGKLVSGKEYLMDIFEIANVAFASRDEMMHKMEAMKWKGLYQMNRDIMDMQSLEGEINHLAKLEEFLRVKGSIRLCEADEIEECRRLEEIEECRQSIQNYDELLDAIYEYAGTDSAPKVKKIFETLEINNFSIFELLCEVLQASCVMTKDLEVLRQRILDQREFNEAREEREINRITLMTAELEAMKEITQDKMTLNINAETKVLQVLRGIDDLVRLSQCRITPLMSLLGNHKEVTKFNVKLFLKIMEEEIKRLIEVVYNAVKPPQATPTKGKKVQPAEQVKLVADPKVIQLRPNPLDKLMPYIPCAYCVEDYLMNLVYETPATPLTKDYINNTIFRLEDVNTKFGIFSLTIPAKRHPYRGSKNN